MKHYLHKFADQSAYNTAKAGQDFYKPTVSLIEDDKSVVFDSFWPEMIDLGLPSGTLWAKTNLGAQTETEYGDYYQWAATTPLHVEGTMVNPPADWNLCPYTDDGETFDKYTGEDYDTLQTEDDVVASQFTDLYRMPTQDDFQELIDGTDNEWTYINDVYGYKFTNKSDSSKYIFLPAAGSCADSNLTTVGVYGYYRSSSLNIDAPDSTWYLDFGNAGIDAYAVSPRYIGYSVRPVQHIS